MKERSRSRRVHKLIDFATLRLRSGQAPRRMTTNAVQTAQYGAS